MLGLAREAVCPAIPDAKRTKPAESPACREAWEALRDEPKRAGVSAEGGCRSRGTQGWTGGGVSVRIIIRHERVATGKRRKSRVKHTIKMKRMMNPLVEEERGRGRRREWNVAGDTRRWPRRK